MKTLDHFSLSRSLTLSLCQVLLFLKRTLSKGETISQDWLDAAPGLVCTDIRTSLAPRLNLD